MIFDISRWPIIGGIGVGVLWGRSNKLVYTYTARCSARSICGIGPGHSVRPTPYHGQTYPNIKSGQEMTRISWPDGDNEMPGRGTWDYFTAISLTGSAGRRTRWTGQLSGLASLKGAVQRMSARTDSPSPLMCKALQRRGDSVAVVLTGRCPEPRRSGLAITRANPARPPLAADAAFRPLTANFSLLAVATLR